MWLTNKFDGQNIHLQYVKRGGVYNNRRNTEGRLFSVKVWTLIVAV
jgi:hypothetical protein